MKPVNMLIKPASAACNMNCDYCFYREIVSCKENPYEGMMSMELMESLISQSLESATGYTSFTFQGGEPTLRGLEFYKEVVRIQKELNKKNIRILNSIQTNGICMNDEWAEFLAENNFLVGLSLDGPGWLHNKNRKMNDGTPTFDQVMLAAYYLKKAGADFNILCVVTRETAENIQEVYEFYKNEGFHHLQFIPCLEPLNKKRGLSSQSLDIHVFADYLCKLFDLWYEDFIKDKYISIRHIDNYIHMCCNRPPEACNMSGQCHPQLVIEANGNVYPCDFYAFDEWCIGNLNCDSLQDIMKSPISETFQKVSYFVPDKCRSCRHAFLCRNGCRRDRSVEGEHLNYYCESWFEFFDKSSERMIQIARNQ